jgi:hypothetical protein
MEMSRVVCSTNKQLYVQKICHCSNLPAHCIKNQFYCTAEVNVLKRLKTLFFSALPTLISSHEWTHHITVLCKEHYVRQQHMIDCNIDFEYTNLKIVIKELFIKHLLFMGDVLTAIMNHLQVMF